MAAIADWIGKYAEVRDPGTPGWGPEGTVKGVGGFIVRKDDRGRPTVRLSHYYGKSNRSLVDYGKVAFEMETLHVTDSVRSWGEDDRPRRESEA